MDYSSNSDKLVLQIDASDPDEGVNGTLSYFIRSSNLFHMGSNVSSGSVVPSPFHVTTDGRLLTDSLMAEYNQDRFVLEVVAREEAAPFREDSARVHVWVYEPDQLSKVQHNPKFNSFNSIHSIQFIITDRSEQDAGDGSG